MSYLCTTEGETTDAPEKTSAGLCYIVVAKNCVCVHTFVCKVNNVLWLNPLPNSSSFRTYTIKIKMLRSKREKQFLQY